MKYLTFTIFVVLFTLLLGQGLKKNDIHQCITHFENLTKYPDYYITGNQFDTCIALDIMVEDDLRECNGVFYYSPEGTAFHCE